MQVLRVDDLAEMMPEAIVPNAARANAACSVLEVSHSFAVWRLKAHP